MPILDHLLFQQIHGVSIGSKVSKLCSFIDYILDIWICCGLACFSSMDFNPVPFFLLLLSWQMFSKYSSMQHNLQTATPQPLHLRNTLSSDIFHLLNNSQQHIVTIWIITSNPNPNLTPVTLKQLLWRGTFTSDLGTDKPVQLIQALTKIFHHQNYSCHNIRFARYSDCCAHKITIMM